MWYRQENFDGRVPDHGGGRRADRRHALAPTIDKAGLRRADTARIGRDGLAADRTDASRPDPDGHSYRWPGGRDRDGGAVAARIPYSGDLSDRLFRTGHTRTGARDQALRLF